MFVRVLMDDVMALEPGFVEMEATCRESAEDQKLHARNFGSG